MLALLLSISLVGADPDASQLISQLDHKEFSVRRRATRILLSRSDEAAWLAVREGLTSFETETRYRCRHIWKAYLERVRPSNGGDMPWIDMLPEGYPNRDEVWLEYLRKYGVTREGQVVTPNMPRHEYGWREATRRLVYDLLTKEKKSRKEVVQMLDKMLKAERKWKSDEKVIAEATR